MHGTAIGINYSNSEGIMNTLTKSETMTKMEGDHIYIHRDETICSPKYLLNVHYFFQLLYSLERNFGCLNTTCNEYSTKI